MLTHIILKQSIVLMVKEKVKEILVLVRLTIDGNDDVLQAHQLHLASGQGLVKARFFAV
jgi:hypothetical protein